MPVSDTASDPSPPVAVSRQSQPQTPNCDVRKPSFTDITAWTGSNMTARGRSTGN